MMDLRVKNYSYRFDFTRVEKKLIFQANPDNMQ